MARKMHHIAISYQYRIKEKNIATIVEERQLGLEYGIQSCSYEQWANSTMAMSFTMRTNDKEAMAQAIKHLRKMIYRRHFSMRNVRLTELFIDSELSDEFGYLLK